MGKFLERAEIHAPLILLPASVRSFESPDARCGTEMRQGEAVKWSIIIKSTLRYRNRLVLTPRCRRDFNPVAVIF
jgi:hypothetical protein